MARRSLNGQRMLHCLSHVVYDLHWHPTNYTAFWWTEAPFDKSLATPFANTDHVDVLCIRRWVAAVVSRWVAAVVTRCVASSKFLHCRFKLEKPWEKLCLLLQPLLKLDYALAAKLAMNAFHEQ